KQEIQLAWKYQRPYLPLLLDDSVQSGFPEQVEYWLEGCQWIEVLDRPPDAWLTRVMQSLARVGVVGGASANPGQASRLVLPARFLEGLDGLWRLAAYTDQIRPEPARADKRGHTRSIVRDLGELPEEAQYRFHLGDRICLSVETERA